MNEFNLNFYKGKKVLVTGHTGFNGDMALQDTSGVGSGSEPEILRSHRQIHQYSR